MVKDSFYEMYKREEHYFKKFYDTLLLAELLRLNNEYSIQKYNGARGKDVFRIVTRKEQYSEEEKEKMIKDALTVLNIKYNYPIEDDIIDQFDKISFQDKG